MLTEVPDARHDQIPETRLDYQMVCMVNDILLNDGRRSDIIMRILNWLEELTLRRG